MEQLFWIGQVGWIAFLACGAYVSFCFFDLADEEHAKTARSGKAARTTQPEAAHPGFVSMADGV